MGGGEEGKTENQVETSEMCKNYRKEISGVTIEHKIRILITNEDGHK